MKACRLSYSYFKAVETAPGTGAMVIPPATDMHTRHLIPVVVLLAACSGNMPMLPSLTPYRMDIQQGNVVTQDMIAKVQPGMTRSQVRFALGTPLIMDPFHSDRWDYVFLYQKAGTVTEQRRIVVVFKDDRLVRIEGDVVPAGTGGLPGDVKTGKPAAAPAKPASPAAPKPAGEPPASAAPVPGAAASPLTDVIMAKADPARPEARRRVRRPGLAGSHNAGFEPWPHSS